MLHYRQRVFTLAALWLVALSCCCTLSSGESLAETSAVRNAKANEVLKYLNLSADPCMDFYDFACGNWAKYNPSLGPEEVTTPQTQLELRVHKDLQLLLEEPANRRDAQSTRKVKDFYRSCVTVDSPSQVQHNFLVALIKNYGGLPAIPGTQWNGNYDWVKVAAMLRLNYGLELLIGLEVDHPDRGIYLTEPKVSLIPEKLCNAVASAQRDIRHGIDQVLQANVAQNMQTWFSMREAEANRFAGDIIQFEFSLCKRMRIDQIAAFKQTVVPDRDEHQSGYRRGQSRFDSPYPPQSLQKLNAKFHNQIDFKMFVDISLNTSINDEVFMKSEVYFQNLERIIKSNAKPTVANYIMYRLLEQVNFPSNLRSHMRPKYCVTLVQRYFPKILGDMYNRRFQRNVAPREDVKWMWDEVSKAFEERLSVEWMDRTSRQAAVQKLEQMRALFPDYQNLDLSELPIESANNFWRKLEMIMNYNARRQQYDREYADQLDQTEAFDVRVRLNPIEKKILIGWGLLQPPFYHQFYPNALKFSLVAQHIARELVSAFDEQGFNPNPLSPMIWSAFNENFHNRSECFRVQYSNYLNNNPDAFRNMTKLREIIADSAGLSVAFNAYLAWLSTESELPSLRKETLRDVNFTNTQLFFIHFAQTRCVAKYDERLPPEFLPLDRHTAERYAINGPLANFAEFAREFGCTMGSEMNPGDKCVVY